METEEIYFENARVQRRGKKEKPTIRDIEPLFRDYYNINGYDEQLLKYRIELWGLQRIMRFLVEKMPVFDEIHLLCHLLNILNQNNLAVSRREVLNCFNQYYKKSEHGDKRSYLGWIYKEFTIKHGTVVRTSQIRKPKQKTSLFSGISNTKVPIELKENQSLTSGKGNNPQITTTHENTPIKPSNNAVSSPFLKEMTESKDIPTKNQGEQKNESLGN